MRMILSATFLLLGLGAAAAQHQHHAAASGGESRLPEACRFEAPAGMTSAHGAMDASGLSEHQRKAMEGMVLMDRDMMAGMMAEDADMAFMCGMIAHHQGAIAMSETVLEFGDDPAARALAERIIAAQKAEIEEMTKWVEEQAVK